MCAIYTTLSIICNDGKTKNVVRLNTIINY